MPVDTGRHQLACLTIPVVRALEGGVAKMHAQVADRKESSANKERLLADHNPRAFRTLQVCASAGLLDSRGPDGQRHADASALLPPSTAVRRL